jgi:hypothetical protein
MGTRAQINIQQGNKVVSVYTGMDGFPRNILQTLRAAASAGRSTPFRIAQAVVREWGSDTMRIIGQNDDQSKWVSYLYNVDVSKKPWRVRYTQEETVDLPTLPNGELDDSNEAFAEAKTNPAVTRYTSIAA